MTMPSLVGFPPGVADANAARKAALIAEYAWRLGITFDELGTLPYSDKTDRHRPTLRRFAAAAFRAAGAEENVPHSRTSETWRRLKDELADLADRARFGFGDPPPPRDLLPRRSEWMPLPAAAAPEEEPDDPQPDWPERLGLALVPPPPPSQPRQPRPADLVPYAAGEVPALVTSGCPPLLRGSRIGPPRGWLELAQLGSLPGRLCRWCGSAAIVGTLNGWRCALHWPWPGDPKGDWGWQLNWAPQPGVAACLASRCYCGRCPHYDVTGQPVRSLRPGGAVDTTPR